MVLPFLHRLISWQHYLELTNLCSGHCYLWLIVCGTMQRSRTELDNVSKKPYTNVGTIYALCYA
jgi:hypothetical protein